MPNMELAKFRQLLKANGRRRDWPEMKLLNTPYSILSLGKYVLIPSEMISSDPAVVTICVKRYHWLFVSKELLQE